MNIESMAASNSPGVTARPPGDTKSAPPQTSRVKTDSASQGLEQKVRSDAQASATKEPDKQQVTDAVEKLSKFVSNIRTEISFSVDDTSGTRVVKVIDKQSDEVLRQIPSEEAIQLAQALDKLQGLFVRETA